MAKRRELTEEEDLWAKNLKRIWLAKKDELGLTQLSAGLALGYTTQSAFSQYVNGKIPLNTDAKAAIAKLLQVDASEIDPAFHVPLSGDDDAAELRHIFSRLSPAARAQVIGFAKGLAASDAGAVGLINVPTTDPEAIKASNEQSDLRAIDAEQQAKKKYDRRRQTLDEPEPTEEK